MTYELHEMDCRLAMSLLMDADSVDSIVCDPPYGLSKEPDMAEVLRHWLAGDDYTHGGSGFMGKTWDSFVPGPSVWREAYRVLKPGGYLIAFFGTRTYDLGTLAIRLAGFEIRDQLAWVFGQGFPKSHNLDNERGKTTCGCEEHTVPNTHDRTEPQTQHDLRTMCHADLSTAEFNDQKCTDVLFDGLPQSGIPLAERGQLSASQIRTGEHGLEGRRNLSEASRELRVGTVCSLPSGTDRNGSGRRLCDGTPASNGEMGGSYADTNRVCPSRRPQSAEQRAGQSGTMAGQPESQTGGAWPVCGRCDKPIVARGLGTALKPAYEPIVLARKPLSERTVAANVLTHGTGGLNVDGCRVGTTDNLNGGAYAEVGSRTALIGDGRTDVGQGMWQAGMTAKTEYVQPLGRWPANLCHDGSDEVLAGFPVTSSGKMRAGTIRAAQDEPGSVVYGTYGGNATDTDTIGDSGSAARFYYCAKASKADRSDGNTHPTVKPTDLMRWLCRLVTPPGGTVFDPFAGSGSTGKAALLEGFQFVGCEMTPEYAAIARARLDAASVRGG